MFRLPRRSHARHLYQRIDELTQRIERLEGNQARIQSDVAVQLRHADVAIEDLVAALEEVRARAESHEPPR